MLLVLPVLIAVFLGLATASSLFLGKIAVSQAAQNGVQAWAAGESPTQVDQVVEATLTSEGYDHAQSTISTTSNGASRTVAVSVPYRVLNTGATTSLAAERTFTMASSNPAPPPSSGSGGGGGGGGYVYHHFPMW
jgi:Flp pilus assembly protein TadG